MVRAIYSSRAAQHHNPVPNAAVRNGLMMTSGILGKDLETDDYPKEREKQVALVFKHVVAILEDAGAGLQDVIKVDLYFADKTDRTMANQHWERLWPDPAHSV